LNIIYVQTNKCSPKDTAIKTPQTPYLQPFTSSHPTLQTALPIFCNQQVNGSNPLIGSKRNPDGCKLIGVLCFLWIVRNRLICVLFVSYGVFLMKFVLSYQDQNTGIYFFN